MTSSVTRWKIFKWIRSIRQNGPIGAVQSFWRMSDTKAGQLVGTDHLGNRYFQDLNETILGRDRWVDLADKNYPKDPSSIPPEWHAWMHRMTDIPPSAPNASQFYAERPVFVAAEHRSNLTGTESAYRPYSTVSPKISAWQGKPAEK